MLRSLMDERESRIKELENEISQLKSTQYNTINLKADSSDSQSREQLFTKEEMSPFFSNLHSLGQSLDRRRNIDSHQTINLKPIHVEDQIC